MVGLSSVLANYSQNAVFGESGRALPGSGSPQNATFDSRRSIFACGLFAKPLFCASA